jgi:trypsin-like peptidase
MSLRATRIIPVLVVCIARLTAASAVEPDSAPPAPASEGPQPAAASSSDTDECVLPRTKGRHVDETRLAEPEVFRCLLKAAENPDDGDAVEWAQMLLWEGQVQFGSSGPTVGGLFPRSESRLKKYIDVGVRRGSHYSILAKAAYLQDIDPAASTELYKRVALKDDCRGQIMLAWMYQQGIGTEINEAVAYFWARLARRRDFNPFMTWQEYKDNRTGSRPVPYFEQRAAAILRGTPNIKWEQKHYCRDLYPIVDLPRLEGAPFAEEVHDLLLEWRVGQDAPEALTRFAGRQFGVVKGNEPAAPPKRKPEPDSTTFVRWQPIKSKFAPAASRPKSFETLYEELSKSVYVIVAAPSTADLRARRNLAQGSAVAIDPATLITNCHIVRGRPMVYVVGSDGPVQLKLVAARVSADTCVLGADTERFSSVVRVRSFASLKVGEPVLAIGSPHGFASTLSTGIISQLRRDDKQRLVQTTAPISGGSSGGGLFDQHGNLVGITTFSIRDAESLHFAIAIDEYL